MNAQLSAAPHNPSDNLAGRIGGLVFALCCYAIGAGSLFWLFFAAGGFAPYGLAGSSATLAGAVAINALLVLAFAVQHTVMARKTFKTWLTRQLPAHLERATYVLMSGLFMGLLVYAWQPLPGTLWQVESPLLYGLLMLLYAGGMLYVLASSLVTNHFELFGLRQAWLHFRNVPYTPLAFRRVWFYRFSRHPMMLGLLGVFWGAPQMSATRFCLAVLLTAYLFAGIRFEEAGLIREFGDKYRAYRKEVGMFFTLRQRS